MRISISHSKTRQEAIKIIDEGTDKFMQGVAGPVQITDQRKSWNGSKMDFGFTGRMGPFSTPMNGTVEVTDTDIIIDVELPGILKNFLPEEKVRTEVQNRVRGLLN
jgi:hypothetical protein